MSDHTAISWTDTTLNWVIGCTHAGTPGCDNCYAPKQVRRRVNDPQFAPLTVMKQSGVQWTGQLLVLRDRMEEPLRWRNGRKVFVNSLSDLFHDDIDREDLVEWFAIMAAAQFQTFQILTKRPHNMAATVGDLAFIEEVRRRFESRMDFEEHRSASGIWPGWPLPNVWLGTSTENQATADERIPHLLNTPAAVRFLSCEPLLGAINAREHLKTGGIHWVITGGESGHKARPMHPEWARSLRDQCADLGVAFWFKQVGTWTWELDRAKPTAALVTISSNGKQHGQPGFDAATAVTLAKVGKGVAGEQLDGQLLQKFPPHPEFPFPTAVEEPPRTGEVWPAKLPMAS